MHKSLPSPLPTADFGGNWMMLSTQRFTSECEKHKDAHEDLYHKGEAPSFFESSFHVAINGFATECIEIARGSDKKAWTSQGRDCEGCPGAVV